MNARPALALALLGLAAFAPAQKLYGVSFRTGGQTSGLNPNLYDVDPATGAATNRRAVNVNNAVGIAVNPATGRMYGLTDQFGRINNASGQGGKNLLFEIDPATGGATGIGRLDPGGATSFEMYEGDLAFNPADGTLWAMSTRVTQGVLMTVDLATGRGTVRSVFAPIAGVTNFDVSAMAFSATGDLWVLDTTYPDASAGPARLMRVDPLDGSLLQSFVTGTALGSAAGMTFAPNGDLLVADGDTGGTGSLYRVAFGAGSASLVAIGATGANAGGGNIFERGLSGLAYEPVPEPATMLALGAGIAAFARRRR